METHIKLYDCVKLHARLTLSGCEANRKKSDTVKVGQELRPLRPSQCKNCKDWKKWK